MWRSYDMADGSSEWDNPVMADREVVTERTESERSWLMPRLALRVDTERHDRIVRIPPGFISC